MPPASHSQLRQQGLKEVGPLPVSPLPGLKKKQKVWWEKKYAGEDTAQAPPPAPHLNFPCVHACKVRPRGHSHFGRYPPRQAGDRDREAFFSLSLRQRASPSFYPPQG